MKTAVLIAIITLTVTTAFLQVTARRKGVCYTKYTKEAGCRKRGEFARKKVNFDDCCKNKGKGWSANRRGRKTCRPCVEVKIETGYWSSWGKWTGCSKTCGTGQRQRKRQCISKQNTTCSGREMQARKCQRTPCPVNGGWTSWSTWGPCSVTCGKGHQNQIRSCSNPKPQHGGKECQGSPEKWKACLLQEHCPIDGGWGEWSAWGACSKTCGLGRKTRSHKCDSPKPKYGGKPCNESEALGVDYCREERCGKTSVGCDESYEDCSSGSGSGWKISSGSGSSGLGSGSGEQSGSGAVASGEGLSGDSKPLDDEDFS
ncbi:thrombospondin-1-like [Actinia tenebrosa]|uniref:Thrombospondin-1-like n=1 Tax=Actinia tenebrosa TaxID=6105 RepID=A0A6P8J9S2_ACTTE|nr:thrombospondin-1-like [Actinia tenebrosa]XP_031574494.1 thrombospondin-1-like [Actinia tenebrosa]